jgi:hypothetical protein
MGRTPSLNRTASSDALLLRLLLAPETEYASAYPKKSQAVEADA